MFKVGMPGTGRLFMSCRAASRYAHERCGFQAPGQLTHIFRYTFASHYLMGGGDILTLKRILGHSSITMTMWYAHLSPEHLRSALTYSPLALSNRQIIFQIDSFVRFRLEFILNIVLHIFRETFPEPLSVFLYLVKFEFCGTADLSKFLRFVEETPSL